MPSTWTGASGVGEGIEPSLSAWESHRSHSSHAPTTGSHQR
jgi:hypothetical protein